jgi:hypothetical protein
MEKPPPALLVQFLFPLLMLIVGIRIWLRPPTLRRVPFCWRPTLWLMELFEGREKRERAEKRIVSPELVRVDGLWLIGLAIVYFGILIYIVLTL